MRICDIHIHLLNTEPLPQKLMDRMKKSGIDYGCVFSNWPDRVDKRIGTSFDDRLNEVLSWTKDYEDNLFPVLWIHPYEDNIIENIHKAVEKGVCGFKIICTDFFVYEDKCMNVLSEIAKLNKPVFFHTGILWDGKASSKYNRPLNWEELIDIEGLKFSMGHCSWPWIDECISLYGKFLHSLSRSEDNAEMFFDLTPGTPMIYRRELLNKLFTIGYDVEHNIMFGTDCSAEDYKENWARKWLAADEKIMDELRVVQRIRENLYYNNIMRFLGKTDTVIKHKIPSSDDANEWVCYE